MLEMTSVRGEEGWPCSPHLATPHAGNDALPGFELTMGNTGEQRHLGNSGTWETAALGNSGTGEQQRWGTAALGEQWNLGNSGTGEQRH
ncbi:hypothetical protein ACOMHN_049922 [Nucella lapillus]